MRHTSSHTGRRRSHHALRAAAVSKCVKCGAGKLPHKVCVKCGFYKGREVFDVLKNKKIEKKKKN